MWTFHILLVATCSIAFVHSAKSKYNDDEDNPYEFGFTIDGQQHRHEKKDANGIIQGEFGFITADGIYHVTVYATDEDGNFKILSMRNVRVSGPLDGPNAKLPDTSQFSKEGNKVPPSAPPKPLPPRAPNPLSIEPPSAPIQSVAPQHLASPVQSVTLRPNNIKFTTQVPIKPACAGCSYVTTQKSTNGGKLPFQTQAFLNPKPGTVVIGSVEDVKEKPTYNQQSAKPVSNFPTDNRHTSAGNNQDKPGFPTTYPNNQQSVNPGFSSNYPNNNQDQGQSAKPGFPTAYPNNNGNGQSTNPGFPTNYPDTNQQNNSNKPGFSSNRPGSTNDQNNNYNNQNDEQYSKPGFATNYPGNNEQSTNPETHQENHNNNQGFSNSRPGPTNNQNNNYDNQNNKPSFATNRPSGQQNNFNDNAGPNQENYNNNPGFSNSRPGPTNNQNNNYNNQNDKPSSATNRPSGEQNYYNGNTGPASQPNQNNGFNNQAAIAETPYVNPLSIESDNPNQQNYNTQVNKPGSLPGAVGIVNNNPNALGITRPNQGNSPAVSRPANDIVVSNGFINVPNNAPIAIKDKFPNMVDGLPAGINTGDITDLLYKFNYTVGFHGHYEKGYKNGAKVGGYFVNDRDGVSRIVTYVADENGYRPKVKFIRLDLNSDLVPKEGSEKTFGLQNFEFVWYPLN